MLSFQSQSEKVLVHRFSSLSRFLQQSTDFTKELKILKRRVRALATLGVFVWHQTLQKIWRWVRQFRNVLQLFSRRLWFCSKWLWPDQKNQVAAGDRPFGKKVASAALLQLWARFKTGNRKMNYSNCSDKLIGSTRTPKLSSVGFTRCFWFFFSLH